MTLPIVRQVKGFLRFVRRDLALKLLLLSGGEVSKHEIYEHGLDRWADAIGRGWSFSAHPNRDYFRLAPKD